LGPATVGGVRVLRAGRLGDGWLVVREAAAVGAAVKAEPGALWDERFRLTKCEGVPNDAVISALGNDAAGLRRLSRLPSAVLRTLPAIRIGEMLACVPHLGYSCHEFEMRVTMVFSPSRPLAGASFLPAL
jgi:tRNA(Ile)-lysidine synthase